MTESEAKAAMIQSVIAYCDIIGRVQSITIESVADGHGLFTVTVSQVVKP